MKKLIFILTICALHAQAMENPSKERCSQPESNHDQLFHAVLNDLPDAAHKLLASGIDVNAISIYGTTALWQAAYWGHASICKLLIEYQADIHTEDRNGVTAFSTACKKGHAPVVRLFLEHGADPDERDKENKTPLMYAATNGHAEVCKLLLAYNAKIDTQDVHGCTALINGTFENNQEICKILITHSRMYRFPTPSAQKIQNAQHRTRMLIWALNHACPALPEELIEKILRAKLLTWRDACYTPLTLHSGCYKRIKRFPLPIIRTLVDCEALDIQEVAAQLKTYKLEQLKPLMIEAAEVTEEQEIKNILNPNLLEQNFGKEIEEIIIADCKHNKDDTL